MDETDIAIMCTQFSFLSHHVFADNKCRKAVWEDNWFVEKLLVVC